jgi:hypothetical protein
MVIAMALMVKSRLGRVRKERRNKEEGGRKREEEEGGRREGGRRDPRLQRDLQEIWNCDVLRW